MKTKIFTKNSRGKIEFTEDELGKLLDEIYEDGYNDGRSTTYIYSYPYYGKKWWDPWYYGTTTAGNTILNYCDTATAATTSTCSDSNTAGTTNMLEFTYDTPIKGASD